jgi:hypothetical protein
VARVLEQEGFDVRRLAFCFRDADDLEDLREPIMDVGRMQFWGSDAHKAYGPCRHHLSEYLATVAALQTPDILTEFTNYIRATAPEVILLEHPWTWPLLERLAEVHSGKVRIVYNSQNVEIALKRRILDEHGITPPSMMLSGIEALERGLVNHAAGICCCTRVDANIYASWGARRVLVAPNGGVQRDRGHLLDILPWPVEPAQSYGLAIGSLHPPNVSGFMNLIAPSLPFLRPYQRVVLAGGAGPEIVQALEAKGLGQIAYERLISLGAVDEFCLDCAIANARVLLLPIQYGGGSNVKTAEALLSRRPMLATVTAMRGFEKFLNVPGVTLVADEGGEFGRAMLTALDHPLGAKCPDCADLSSLLWESTITPLVELMRELEEEITADPRWNKCSGNKGMPRAGAAKPGDRSL